MPQSEYGRTGLLDPARIRRARSFAPPRPQTFTAPERLPRPMTAAPAATSDYGGAPAAVSSTGGSYLGGRITPRGPTAPAITPGQGAYSDVGPGDPGGYLSAPYSSPYAFGSLQDLERYLIRAGGQEGVFQPGYLSKFLRDRALRNAASQRNRGRLLGTLAGFDPSQQREAILSSDIAASSDLTGALNEADLAGGSDYMNFIRQLLTGERGGEQSYFTQRDLMELEDRLRGSGIEQFLGQAGGAALGGLVG